MPLPCSQPSRFFLKTMSTGTLRISEILRQRDAMSRLCSDRLKLSRVVEPFRALGSQEQILFFGGHLPVVPTGLL